MLKELAEKYFNFFNDKNIEQIADLFSKNITLCDWEIDVSGKEKVLDATKNIFDNVESIDINIINIYEYGQDVIAELNIILNQKDILFVVDIITFDLRGKIASIRAYKR